MLEPFATGQARRHPIERIAADTGTRWVRDVLAWVDRQGRTVHTASKQELPYDALVLAVGGRQRAPAAGLDLFTAGSADDTFHAVVQDIETGTIGSLAFALPAGPSWPLPLYELALLTAQRSRDRNVKPDIAFITPEARPLQTFGGSAGEAVAGLLADAGITLYTGSSLQVVGPRPDPAARRHRAAPRPDGHLADDHRTESRKSPNRTRPGRRRPRPDLQLHARPWRGGTRS